MTTYKITKDIIGFVLPVMFKIKAASEGVLVQEFKMIICNIAIG